MARVEAARWSRRKRVRLADAAGLWHAPIMRPILGIPLVLLACDAEKATPDAEDSAAHSPYAMPAYGGCTYTFDRDDGDDGDDDYSLEQAFDAEERLVSERVSMPLYYDQVSAWTYDSAGCLSAFDRVLDMDPLVGDIYDSATHYTQRCDDAANVVAREGIYNNEPFTVAYANRYELDTLVEVTATLSWTGLGTSSALAWIYAWEGGARILSQSFEDGAQLDEERWTWDGETLLSYSYGQVVSGEIDFAYTYTYTYDEQGRQLTLTRSTPDDGDTSRTSYTWYDSIYHTLRTSYDAGPDGAADQLLDYDCAEGWPWTCAYRADGDPVNRLPPDGVADSSGLARWRCD